MKMTRNEYLARLKSELENRKIADADDIVSEYEQHFAFKLADGYTEEEIAAKLGSAKSIAEQFGEFDKRPSGGRVLLKIALACAAFFEAVFYIIFSAFAIILGAASIALAATGLSLVFNFDISGLIPEMPYIGALLIGVCLLGLALLFFIAAFYCLAQVRQMIKASVRWHKNMTSSNALPPLPWSPRFNNKTRRGIRAVFTWSLIIFGVFFILGYCVLAIKTGDLEFWHALNWFM